MMTDYEPSRQGRPSVYSLGALDGLWAGLAMSVCFICMIYSSTAPVAGLLSLAVFIVTPYLVWRLLRKAWTRGDVPGTFSAVWLHGICVFLFGSILLALVMYLTLQHFAPGWLESQTLLAAERLTADHAHQAEARQAMAIVNSGALPSPIYTAFSTIWFVAFTGSLWSMVFAAILTRTAHFRKLRANNILNNEH